MFALLRNGTETAPAAYVPYSGEIPHGSGGQSRPPPKSLSTAKGAVLGLSVMERQALSKMIPVISVRDQSANIELWRDGIDDALRASGHLHELTRSTATQFRYH